MLSETILCDLEEKCSHLDGSFFANKKVLITGASGLIGTYILAYLARLVKKRIPIEVYAQVLSDPPPQMTEIVQLGGFRILRVDLADFAEYVHLPEADIIIHAAGYGQPLRFMANPGATLQINVAATLFLLRRLRPGGRFLFTSSSGVYAGLNESRFTEDDIGRTTPYHPRACYIEGKRGGEAACFAFRSQGVGAVSVRLGDTYGPGTRIHDKRALNSFIEKALFQHKIELLDKGTAVRNYCYVADAVELMLRIVLHGKEPVYNVGGCSDISFAELAYRIGDIMKVPVVIPSIGNNVVGASELLRVDLGRVEKEFGKNDYISLNDGLARTIEWQRKLYSANLKA